MLVAIDETAAVFPCGEKVGFVRESVRHQHVDRHRKTTVSGEADVDPEVDGVVPAFLDRAAHVDALEMAFDQVEQLVLDQLVVG
jgi:hypothetical protein